MRVEREREEWGDEGGKRERSGEMRVVALFSSLPFIFFSLLFSLLCPAVLSLSLSRQ